MIRPGGYSWLCYAFISPRHSEHLTRRCSGRGTLRRAAELHALGLGDVVTEAFDDVIREYVDFVNQQVGAYMDALAGFAGHYARVERQLHRVNRPVRSQIDSAGQQVVVWASYEDPTKPDIIHNRIIRAQDYLAVNAKGGSNEQQHAKAIVVFLFTYWEDEIRPRLLRFT